MRRLVSTRLILFSLLLLFCSVKPGKAAYGPVWDAATCRWYFEGDDGVAPEMVRLLRQTGAVKDCYFHPNQIRVYFVATKPQKGPQGVCQYWLDQRYQELDGTWGYVPPKDFPHPPVSEAFMSITDGPCPRPDDPSYIQTSDISDGLFASFMRYWSTITASPSELGAALEKMVRKAPREEVVRFVANLPFSGGPGNIRLTTIALVRSLPKLGGLSYEAIVSAPQRPREPWVVTFDILPTGFQILNVHQTIE